MLEVNSKARVLGFCGNNYKNIGDDAFMLVLADQVSNFYQNAEVMLTSSYLPEGLNNKQYIKAIYQDMSSLKFAHLWRLILNGKRLTSACYFGGSVLHENIHFKREIIKINVLRKFNPGLRVGALGVSIGPFYSKLQKTNLLDFLNSLDYVAVRDLPSLDFLKERHVQSKYEHGFDLAALLLDRPEAVALLNSEKKAGPPVLGIAPCPIQRYHGDGTQNGGDWLDKFSLSLKRLSHLKNLRLKFFEFNGHATHGDLGTILKICQELEGKFDIEICYYSPDPLRFLHEIRACDGILTMRLHSSVFAFLMQIPQVMLAYHDKCSAFADEIGLRRDHVFAVNNFESGSLAKSLLKMLESNCHYSTSLDQGKSSAQSQIINFFT
jgi:polysaccharide pyruvyl transferase WcaK-like protein